MDNLHVPNVAYAGSIPVGCSEERLIMHDKALREKVRAMRATGLSFKVIARQLEISPGTVYIWASDIVLSAEQMASLRSSGRKQAGLTNRRNTASKRIAWRREAELIWEARKSEPLFLCGLGLYWGEGCKLGSALSISNCDPGLLRVWITWCRVYIGNPEFWLQIQLYPDLSDYEAGIYWFLELGIPTVSFSRRVSVNSGKSSKRLPGGTARLALRSGSTEWSVKMKVFLAKLAGLHPPPSSSE